MTGTTRDDVTRRYFLEAAAGSAVALAALGGFGGRLSAAEAKELNILFPGGTWKDWFDQVFVTPFAQKSGTKFVWKTGLGFEPIVIAQRSRPQWDLIHQNQNTSSQLATLNALVEWKEERIPNIKNIHPSFRYPHVVGKVHTPYGLAVNTKRIKKPVDSWSALWDPELAGKVGFPDWIWVGEEVFHAINIVAGGTAENIDPGIAKMAEVYKANKAMTINNVEHTNQVLLSEDVWICPLFGARVEKAKAAGAPVEFVIPKEGGLSWAWNTTIIAGRPQANIELAEQFVNTTLDPEAQLAFCRLTGYPPTNVEAMRNLPPDLKKLELSDSDLQGFGKLQRQTDFAAQFAHRDRNRERWSKEVLGA
jgi:putative spermidine/putrescine transport system substrate-binding protein